ncbi:MAG: LamG domain-containing protein, partial [bacterium]|nr:LamG domain-containing protein [bacterium]
MLSKKLFIIGILLALAVAGYFVYSVLATSNPHDWSTGLVGYWSFDGQYVSGTSVTDQSVNSNTGTLTNGVVATGGVSGQAMSFDGVDDYVTVGDVLDFNYTEARTFEAWVKTNTATGEQNIISKNDINSPYSGWRVEFFNQQIKAQYLYSYPGNYLSVITNDNLISIGQWYHVVVTYNNKVIKIYLNSVEKATTIQANNLTSSIDNAIPVNIGSRHNGNENFNGLIDDVRVYNYARTPEEIRLDYNAGFAALFGPQTGCDQDPGSCMTEGLAGYWGFEEGSGAIAYDSSDNGNTGTLKYMSTSTNAWAKGKFGGALSFAGVDGYVDAETANLPTGASPRTVEFWVKRPSSANF